jgi:hypothetical protein
VGVRTAQWSAAWRWQHQQAPPAASAGPNRLQKCFWLRTLSMKVARCDQPMQTGTGNHPIAGYHSNWDRAPAKVSSGGCSSACCCNATMHLSLLLLGGHYNCGGPPTAIKSAKPLLTPHAPPPWAWTTSACVSNTCSAAGPVQEWHRPYWVHSTGVLSHHYTVLTNLGGIASYN